MVAEPATTPRTKPLELTVATDVLLLAHVIVRPVSEFPLASFGVAVSCAVCPAGTEAEAGLTVTVATGTVTAVTVIAHVPLFLPAGARMVPAAATPPPTRPPALHMCADGL